MVVKFLSYKSDARTFNTVSWTFDLRLMNTFYSNIHLDRLDSYRTYTIVFLSPSLFILHVAAWTYYEIRNGNICIELSKVSSTTPSKM